MSFCSKIRSLHRAIYERFLISFPRIVNSALQVNERATTDSEDEES